MRGYTYIPIWIKSLSVIIEKISRVLMWSKSIFTLVKVCLLLMPTYWLNQPLEKSRMQLQRQTFCLVGTHINLNGIWYINTCLEISNFQILNHLAPLSNMYLSNKFYMVAQHTHSNISFTLRSIYKMLLEIILISKQVWVFNH